MSLTFYKYDKSKYPEHEKYVASRDKRQLIEDFLCFASDKAFYLQKEVEYAELQFTHMFANETELLDQFFGIDEQKMEEERIQMLKELKGEENE